MLLHLIRLGLPLILILNATAGTAAPLEKLYRTCSGAIGTSQGMCAPSLDVMTSHEGKRVQSDDLRGKVVLLHFFATWCEPCKVELPILFNLKKKLPADSFLFLPVSLDEDKAALKAFIEKQHFKGVLQDSKNRYRFQTLKVPETFIINHLGKITDHVAGAWAWDASLVENYLKLLTLEAARERRNSN